MSYYVPFLLHIDQYTAEARENFASVPCCAVRDTHFQVTEWLWRRAMWKALCYCWKTRRRQQLLDVPHSMSNYCKSQRRAPESLKTPHPFWRSSLQFKPPVISQKGLRNCGAFARHDFHLSLSAELLIYDALRYYSLKITLCSRWKKPCESWLTFLILFTSRQRF